GFGNDKGHKLTVVINVFVLERGAAFSRAAGFFERSSGAIEFLSISVMQNCQHSRHFLRLGGFDVLDSSVADRARHCHAIGDILNGMFDCVVGAARDLQFAIDARDRLANHSGAHRSTPSLRYAAWVTTFRARVNVRLASSTLNALS